MKRPLLIIGAVLLAMPLNARAQETPASSPSTGPSTAPSASDVTPAMRERLRELRDNPSAGREAGGGGMDQPRPRPGGKPGGAGPDFARDGGPQGGTGGRGDGPGGGAGAAGENSDRPPAPGFFFSEEEWADVEAFLKIWSPNRLEYYAGLIEGRRKDNLRRLMIVRYRQLQQISEADADLYELMVQQFKNEDQALGVVLKMRRDRPVDSGGLESELKEIVKKIVGNSLEEREKRISMLRESVDKEEKTLQEDKARLEDLVDKRVMQIVERGPDALLRDTRRQLDGRPDGIRPDGLHPDGGNNPQPGGGGRPRGN